MPTIRNSQMAVFDSGAEEQFVQRLMEYFRKSEPSAGPPVSDGTLQKMMETGVKRARSHGIDWEASIAAYIALMFQIAPNFDETTEFRQVLDDPSVPPNQRIDLIAHRVPQSAYVEAAKHYNLSAWFE